MRIEGEEGVGIDIRPEIQGSRTGETPLQSFLGC